MDLDLLESVRQVEAVIFAESFPVGLSKLKRCVYPGVELEQVLFELGSRYNGIDRSLVLMCERTRAGEPGYALRLDNMVLASVRSVEHERSIRRRLAPYPLEVLGVIVRFQPLSLRDISRITGRRCKEDTLEPLFRARWIEVAGGTRRGGGKLYRASVRLLEDLEGFEGYSMADLVELMK